MKKKATRSRTGKGTDQSECAGPRSVTRFDCGGESVVVETCSPEGTAIDEHLKQHAADVIQRAAELGC